MKIFDSTLIMKNRTKKDMMGPSEGLTAPVSAPAEVKKTTGLSAKKYSLKEKEKICANISIEKMEKIRAISKYEGLTLTDTIEACLELAIKTYEGKNGVIRIMSEKKGDASKIFG